MDSPRDDIPDRDLHAYVDGQLAPEEAAQVEEWLARDPAAAARVQDYLDQKMLIRDAADTLEPASADLRTAALERRLATRLAARRTPRRARLAPWMRQAAAAVLLVGAGWIAHGQYAAMQPDLPIYVAEAVGAHDVYATDALRPVEFSAEASDAALQWASARLGAEIGIPTLDALGLELVGSRVLGTAAGPLLYLVYEDGARNRLSVLVARHDTAPDYPALQLASVEGRTVGYWSQGALGYALVAETSDAQIEAIAEEIALAANGG